MLLPVTLFASCVLVKSCYYVSHMYCIDPDLSVASSKFLGYGPATRLTIEPLILLCLNHELRAGSVSCHRGLGEAQAPDFVAATASDGLVA